MRWWRYPHQKLRRKRHPYHKNSEPSPEYRSDKRNVSLSLRFVTHTHTQLFFLIHRLNTKPTLAIFGAVLVVFVPMSIFLDQYVVEAKHSLAIFAVGCYLVWSSYFSFHYHLQRYSQSYKAIQEDKQFYVLSNFIKSALLLSYR